MKITSFEVSVLDVPYIGPVRAVNWANPRFVVLQLRTDDGAVGIGESWGGDPKAIGEQAQALVGKDVLQATLQSLNLPFQSAMYDLAGQALGLPAWKLMGDRHRDRVPVAYWSCHMPPEETAKEAAKAYARGFRVHKLKARSRDIVRQAELMTKATGPDYAIRVDPNTEFRLVENAVRLARELELYNIECFEDPVQKHDLGWTRMLRGKTDIPQALHLGSGLDVLQAVRAEAVDRVNIGGNVENVLAAHAVAEAAGIPIWNQIAGLSLGIQSVFAVHVGCTLRNATLPCDELPFIHENDLIGGAMPAVDGFFQVPTGPGLGVKLDQDALKHYRIG